MAGDKLTVTAGACGAFALMLENNEAEDGVVFRIHHSGLAMKISQHEAVEDDIRFEHEGRLVLVIQPHLAEDMAGAVIEAIAGEDGPTVSIRMPGEGGPPELGASDGDRDSD